MRAWTILGLTGLALSGQAWAGDVGGNAGTKAKLPLSPAGIQSKFEQVADQDWFRLNITKGDHYAVVLTVPNAGYYQSRMYDPKGKERSYAGTFGQHGKLTTPAGFEFTAAETALRFIAVTMVRLDEGVPPVPYQLVATKDCAKDAKTKCSAKVGQKQNGLAQFEEDKDFWRMEFKKGKRYRIELTTKAPGQSWAIRDRAGHYLSDGIGPKVFTSPVTGTLFLDVSAFTTGYPSGIGGDQRTFPIPYSFVVRPL